jgi:hypothetical protein
LLRLVLWLNVWAILEKFSCADEMCMNVQNVHFTVVRMFCKCLVSPFDL